MEIIATSSCPQDIQPVLGTWYSMYNNKSRSNQLQVAFALSGSLYICNNPANPPSTSPYYNYIGPTPVSSSQILKISQTTYSASTVFGENIAVSNSGNFIHQSQGIIDLPDGKLWYGSREPREQVVISVNGVIDTSWGPAISSSLTFVGVGNKMNVGRSDNYVYSATVLTSVAPNPNKLYRYKISDKTYDSTFTNANSFQSCTKILGISGSSGIESVALAAGDDMTHAQILYETGSSYNIVDLNANNIVSDVVQHNNYLYWAGSFTSFNEVSASGWVKTDLNGNVVTGSVDYITGSVGSKFQGIHQLGVQSNGKIILGSRYDFYGYSGSVPGYNFETGSGALIRLNTDGTFDDTFNYPNIVYSYSGSTFSPFDEVYINTLEILDNDEIFAAGVIVGVYDSASYNETINGQGGILLNSNGGIIYN